MVVEGCQACWLVKESRLLMSNMRALSQLSCQADLMPLILRW